MARGLKNQGCYADFAEFLQVIDNQKDRAAMYEDDSDMSEQCYRILVPSVFYSV